MKGCVLWAPVGAFSSDIWNENDSGVSNDLQTLWRAGGCNLDNLVEEGHLIHQATAWVSFTTIIAYNWYDASPSPTLLKTYWRVEVPIRQQQKPTRDPPRPPRPLQCQRLSECESVFISVIDIHGNQRNNHIRRTLWIQCHFMWMMGMMVLSFMSLIAMAMLMMMLMWPWCLMMVFKSSIGISSGFPSSSSQSCWKAHGSVPSHWLSCMLGSNHGPRRSKYSHL